MFVCLFFVDFIMKLQKLLCMYYKKLNNVFDEIHFLKC